MRGTVTQYARAYRQELVKRIILQQRIDALLTLLHNMDRTAVAEYMEWRSDYAGTTPRYEASEGTTTEEAVS